MAALHLMSYGPHPQGKNELDRREPFVPAPLVLGDYGALSATKGVLHQ